MSADAVIKLFADFDADGNGLIDKQELSDVLVELKPGVWTDEKIDLMLQEADQNGDRAIDYTEFVAWAFKADVLPKAFRKTVNLPLSKKALGEKRAAEPLDETHHPTFTSDSVGEIHRSTLISDIEGEGERCEDSLMKDIVRDTMRQMEVEVYAHHDAVLEILATEQDRDLYIDGYLQAYDENFERQPDGNTMWASLYRCREDRTNLDNVKKFLDVKEFGMAKIALVNVVAPQANSNYKSSYTMGPAYDDIANKEPEVRYDMIRHTYQKEMLPAIGTLLLELTDRGFEEKTIRIIVPIIGSAIYSPCSGGAEQVEDIKQITQIVLESLMLVGELNKESVEIELTFPSHWKGAHGVERRMRENGLLKGLKASVKELPDFRCGPAGDITAIVHKHMKEVAKDRLSKSETHRFLIVGGAGNFLRFKGGAGKDTKVRREKVTDPEELQHFRRITAKVGEGAEVVEGAHARFAKRGWALQSGFERGGAGLEEFTIYGLLGSKSSREGMPSWT